MNKIAELVQATFHGLKEAVEYGWAWTKYIVTLGNAPYPPRAKSDTSEQIVPSVIQLHDRTVDRTVEMTMMAEVFLKTLKTKDPELENKFLASLEYQEYEADKNPFRDIKRYYQKFVAKDFLDTLSQEELKEFTRSEPYNSFLNANPFESKPSINPFDSKGVEVTVEEKYREFQKSFEEKKRAVEERVQNFEFDVHPFFYYELSPEDPEYKIRQSFKESKSYSDIIEKLKSDSNFSLTAEGFRKEYEVYKNNIPNEIEDYLRNLGDRENFEKSDEYKGLNSEKLLPDVRGAYGKFTNRKRKEAEYNHYVQEYQKKDDGKYNKFIKSKEYTEVYINPFHTLEELKESVLAFEKRNFSEELPEKHKDFLKSEPYVSLLKNPFTSLNDIKLAYDKFVDQKNQQIEKDREIYLETLKGKLKQETGNDDYFNKFEQSEEFTTMWQSTGKSAEDVKDAYVAYRNKNPIGYGERFWGFNK